MRKINLKWVDRFIKRIKPYVFMRLEDNALIRMPNEVFKLNETGSRIIHHILEGGSVYDFLRAKGDSPELREELERFFIDFSLMWNDAICENYETEAVKRREFTLGYVELPVLAEVALTSLCNIKCKFCYAGCTDEISKEALSLEDFKRVLDIIRYEAGVPSVSFTGGEPLISKDLPDLIEYASKNNGMRVNLISNGTLIDRKMAKKLVSSGLSSAQISIESGDPNVHDNLTGVKGSHSASVNGFKALKKAGLIVHPHFTISSLNRDDILSYAAFSKEIGSERFSGNFIIPAGRGDDESLKVSYSEIGNLVLDIKESAEKEGVRFMWYSPTPMCLFNPITSGFGNKGCSACEGLLSVDPLGNVLPCSSWSEPIGNILERGFRDIWYSDRAKFIRAKKSAAIECEACKDFSVCQGACPLYFNVHGHEELEVPWSERGLLRSEV